MTARGRGGAALDWRLLLIFWAAVAALFAVRAGLLLPSTTLYGDDDDVMRLVTATDLLNGQAWQDLTQYRDNAPFGTSMHWSRLVDAPLALLMLAVRPFVGTATPEAVAVIWPLLLMLPLFILVARLVLYLVPQAGQVTAMALPVVTLALLIEFMPGRVDHHNVQVLLSLVLAVALVTRRDELAGGVIAGIAAGTSLAIGLETLPVIVAATACLALLWLAEPQRYRAPLAGFSATFAAVAIGHFILATAPSRYADLACDGLSMVHLLAIGAATGALLIAASLTAWLPMLYHRLGALAAGGVAFAVLLALFPQCLLNPYAAVDPRLIEIYFGTIREAEPLWTRLLRDPATGIAFALPVLLAVPVTIWRAWREKGERRVDWLMVLALLVAGAAVMLVQMRGARIAAAMALPAAAYLIAAARDAYRSRPRPGGVAWLLGAWLLFASVGQFALIAAVDAFLPGPQRGIADTEPTTLPATSPALLPAAYARLAALPKGNVVAHPAVDTQVLLYTPHAVVSAGFHRNAAGYLDTQQVMSTGTPDQAAAVAAARSIDYVVIPSGAAAAGRFRDWPWLELLSEPDEPLQIYKVRD